MIYAIFRNDLGPFDAFLVSLALSDVRWSVAVLFISMAIHESYG